MTFAERTEMPISGAAASFSATQRSPTPSRELLAAQVRPSAKIATAAK